MSAPGKPTAPPKSPARRRRRAGRTIAVVALTLTAAAVRLWFVDATLGNGEQAAMTPDSPGYLALAGNLSRGVWATAETGTATLTRPPGYPAFIAACGGSIGVLLTVQAVVSALAVPAVYGVCREAGLGFAATFFVTAATAFSPTAVSTSGLVMADSLYAVMFTFAVWSAFRAFRRGGLAAAATAGAIAAAAAFVKPSMIYAAPAIALAGACHGYAIRGRFRATSLGSYVAAFLVPVCTWAAFNGAVHGVPRFSLIGDVTLVDYFGAKVRAKAAVDGGEPMSYFFARDVLRRERAGRPFVEAITAQRADTIRFLREHPRQTAITAARLARSHVLSEPSYLDQQVGGAISPTAIEGVAAFDRAVRVGTLTLAAALLPLAIATIPLVPGRRKRCFRRIATAAVGCVAIAASVYATASVTFLTGSRIVHPADFLSAAAAAAAMTLMTREGLWPAVRDRLNRPVF